jgi:hypothetical protein
VRGGASCARNQNIIGLATGQPGEKGLTRAKARLPAAGHLLSLASGSYRMS